MERAALESRLQVARMLLGLLGGLGRVAIAGFVRRRVVDLADIVALDRESLTLDAVSRIRLGLDFAFNDRRRPTLKGGGEFHQRHPILSRKMRMANLKSPRQRLPTRACPANTRWAGESRCWRSRASLRQLGSP